MAIVEGECQSPVAFLYLRHSRRPDSTLSLPILRDDQFDIGREDVRRMWNIIEPAISTHHLRFHCIVYNDDGGQAVSPMVYMSVMSSNPALIFRPDCGDDTEGELVSIADDAILLIDKAWMRLNSTVTVSFEAKDAFMLNKNGLSESERAEAKCFVDKFLLTDRMIGAGGHAAVFIAVKIRNRRQFACKIVPVSEDRRSTLCGIPPGKSEAGSLDANAVLGKRKRREYLTREYEILKSLSHPNIISLEKVICTMSHIYIFQELITGGDLLSHIDQRGAIPEPQAAFIVFQVLKAVEYLHDNNVAHRDIKPENILLTSWKDSARVLLTDFGQARISSAVDQNPGGCIPFRMRSVVGTYGYTAPEVLRSTKPEVQKGYSDSIDIWSIGCITATLLTNDLMFPDRVGTNSQESTRTGAWSLEVVDHGEAWHGIGMKAKSFVKACLQVDETRRPTAKQALLHQWFTNRHYAADIASAYAHVVENWKPRGPDEDLVETINVPPLQQRSFIERLASDTRSRYFPTLRPRSSKAADVAL